MYDIRAYTCSKTNLRLEIVNVVIVGCQDNAAHMDFVSAVANIRAHIFGIGLKSKFDIKGELFVYAATTTILMSSFRAYKPSECSAFRVVVLQLWPATSFQPLPRQMPSLQDSS